MITRWRSARPNQAPLTPDLAQPPSLRRMLRLSLRKDALRKLRKGDLSLLWKIFKLIAKLEWQQRRLALPELMQQFEPQLGELPLSPAMLERAERLTLAVLRRLYGYNFCMKQALLLYYFYKRAGKSVCVRFGVRKEAGGLQGHAWIECHGIPIAELEDPRKQFVITYTHPNPLLSKLGESFQEQNLQRK
ncbi:lasso peptide biosynthesis B2 protein [Rhodothermus bifroesti]|uniref:lasso peptide biosynthesis B2 protein n=1 Tax=Rhodothermus bifroesti TaxID=2823335 RepID=UPI000CABCFF9|nr:hypothetical protein HRbin18_02124 [bacterium HR18]